MHRKVIHYFFDLFCRGRPRPNLYNHGQLVLFLFKDKLGFYVKPFNDEVQEIEVKENICTKETKAIGALKQSWVAQHITQRHKLFTYCNFLSLVNCQLFTVSCLEIVHDANSSQAFFGWTAKYSINFKNWLLKDLNIKTVKYYCLCCFSCAVGKISWPDSIPVTLIYKQDSILW